MVVSNVRRSSLRFDLVSDESILWWCHSGIPLMPSANSTSHLHVRFLCCIQHSTFQRSTFHIFTVTHFLEFRFPYSSHADHSPHRSLLRRKYTRNQKRTTISPLFDIYTRQGRLSQLHCSTLCMSRSRRMYFWVLSQVSCPLIYIHCWRGMALFPWSLGSRASQII